MPGPMSAPNGNFLLTVKQRPAGTYITGKTEKKRGKMVNQVEAVKRPKRPRPMKDDDDRALQRRQAEYDLSLQIQRGEFE